MNASMPVRKAVFPVAGLGTRFLPATKAQPKEMLPIVDKPLIQYAVEEAYAAGARQMIFVTGRNKRAIEDHFDKAYELEAELAASGKRELISLLATIKPDDMDCVYIRQPQSLGLGHAVGCAESLVGNEPFLLLLADDLLVGAAGAGGVCEQLVAQHKAHACSVIATEDVLREHTNRYGIVGGTHLAADYRLMQVNAMVEKPAPQDAPSTHAIVGRYLLSPRVFHHIRALKPGKSGELQLTDALLALMTEEKLLAYRYQGQRFDCGSKLGYLQANIELGLIHPEISGDLRAYLARNNELL
jgi:UTP--glucose-1-phosphate uridylyltransferase